MQPFPIVNLFNAIAPIGRIVIEDNADDLISNPEFFRAYGLSSVE
jgi:hypothetical protein